MKTHADRPGLARDRHGWRQELDDLMAAVAGGAIVGMPLLYTMEMWWHGMTLGPAHLLALVVAILVLNFVFSLVSGFRRESTVVEAVMESVTSVGIGILFSALILWLIGELKPATISAAEVVGKVLLEAAAVSIGVSFANAQVRDRSRTGADDNGPLQRGDGAASNSEDPEREQFHADLRDASAALAGATVFALNIAPTEEVVLIASRLAPWQLLVLLGFSVALCYVILFASGFEEHVVHVRSLFQNVYVETILTCAIALLVAAALLSLLGESGATSSTSNAVASVVTLGLPATVGAAAGRLIV
jgi:putative integral membrane protein (TIGR02587 family)